MSFDRPTYMRGHSSNSRQKPSIWKSLHGSREQRNIDMASTCSATTLGVRAPVRCNNAVYLVLSAVAAHSR